jgi:hypothetical protein
VITEYEWAGGDSEESRESQTREVREGGERMRTMVDVAASDEVVAADTSRVVGVTVAAGAHAE